MVRRKKDWSRALQSRRLRIRDCWNSRVKSWSRDWLRSGELRNKKWRCCSSRRIRMKSTHRRCSDIWRTRVDLLVRRWEHWRLIWKKWRSRYKDSRNWAQRPWRSRWSGLTKREESSWRRWRSRARRSRWLSDSWRRRRLSGRRVSNSAPLRKESSRVKYKI